MRTSRANKTESPQMMKTGSIGSRMLSLFLVLLLLISSLGLQSFAADKYQYLGTSTAGAVNNTVRFNMSGGYYAYCVDKNVLIVKDRDYLKFSLEDAVTKNVIPNAAAAAKVRAILNKSWTLTSADKNAITAVQYALWNVIHGSNPPSNTSAAIMAIYNELKSNSTTPPIYPAAASTENPFSVTPPAPSGITIPFSASTATFAFSASSGADIVWSVHPVGSPDALESTQYDLSYNSSTGAGTLTLKGIATVGENSFTVTGQTLKDTVIHAEAFIALKKNSSTVLDKKRSQTVVGVNLQKTTQTKSFTVTVTKEPPLNNVTITKAAAPGGWYRTEDRFTFELYRKEPVPSPTVSPSSTATAVSQDENGDVDDGEDGNAGEEGNIGEDMELQGTLDGEGDVDPQGDLGGEGDGGDADVMTTQATAPAYQWVKIHTFDNVAIGTTKDLDLANGDYALKEVRPSSYAIPVVTINGSDVSPNGEDYYPFTVQNADSQSPTGGSYAIVVYNRLTVQDLSVSKVVRWNGGSDSFDVTVSYDTGNAGSMPVKAPEVVAADAEMNPSSLAEIKFALTDGQTKTITVPLGTYTVVETILNSTRYKQVNEDGSDYNGTGLATVGAVGGAYTLYNKKLPTPFHIQKFVGNEETPGAGFTFSLQRLMKDKHDVGMSLADETLIAMGPTDADGKATVLLEDGLYLLKETNLSDYTNNLPVGGYRLQVLNGQILEAPEGDVEWTVLDGNTLEVINTRKPTPTPTATPTPTTTPTPITTPVPTVTPEPTPTTTPDPVTTPAPVGPLDDGFETLAADLIPEGAPEGTAVEDPAEDILLTEAVPLDAPVLPKTAGFPLGLLTGLGALLATAGAVSRKRNSH